MNPADTPALMGRRAAKRAGLRHYFTGKPCQRGHISARYVSTWQCTQCLLGEAVTKPAPKTEPPKWTEVRLRDLRDAIRAMEPCDVLVWTENVPTDARGLHAWQSSAHKYAKSARKKISVTRWKGRMYVLCVE